MSVFVYLPFYFLFPNLLPNTANLIIARKNKSTVPLFNHLKVKYLAASYGTPYIIA